MRSRSRTGANRRKHRTAPRAFMQYPDRAKPTPLRKRANPLARVSSWPLASVDVTATSPDAEAVDAAWRVADSYLKRFFSATAKQKSTLARKAPLTELQSVALHYPDAFVRRACLFFLDHYANESSTGVFVEALRDPVDFVRNAALHSIACETCRKEELCVPEVVSAVAGVLEGDLSAELRTKAIPTLLHLAGRDTLAWEAIGRAASSDPDDIVRLAAADALSGLFVAPRKRYERRQRRHARSARRTSS